MKKLFLFNFLAFTLVSQVFSQNGPAEKWNYYSGGSKNEHAKFVLECADGGFLLVGSSQSKDGQVIGNHGLEDAWIVKRRSNGTLEWAQCIGTPGTEDANQAVEVQDGYVIVGEKDFHAWIFKINKSGNLLWERSYPTPVTGNHSELLAIRKKPDGTFLVGGYTNGYERSAMLWNLNSSGNLINGLSFTIGNSIHEIRIASDGSIIIMGNYVPNEEGCWAGSEVPAHSDVWIARVTNSYNLIWSKYYGGTTYDRFVDGEINSGNEIYFLGRTYCKGQITGPNNVGSNWPDREFTWLAKANASGNLVNVKIVSSHPFLLDVGYDFNCVTLDCKEKPVIGGSLGSLLGQFPAIEKWKTDLSEQEFWDAQTTGSTDVTRNLYDIHFTTEGTYIACGVYSDVNDGGDNYFILQTEKDPDCAGPANKCQNITPISCGQTYSGNTAGRSNTFGISDLNSCFSSSNPFNGGDQLFEVYKPNSSGDLVVTLFSTNIDHDIFLLSTCNPVQCLYRSVNSVDGNGNNIEIIRVNNAPAGYYYILVDGPTASQVGPFNLTVNCGLLDCGNAKPIECKQTLFNESNSSGFNNVSLYCNPSQISDPGTGCTGKEKVYTFLLNSTQAVTINLTNIRDPNDDFELFLFKDCNEDVCLDNSVNPKGQNESIDNIVLTAGRYYIVVDGWKDSEGNYDISVDWNCCTNALELYNCGYVTYQYSGNGSNLRFTFNSTKAIAPGKKWKVGANEISSATSTSFTYTFPSSGEYIICFPYLNANNCLEYCCYRVWISNPFDCFLFDYRFNPNTNNYTFSLDLQGATNIIWKDDTGGGTIGGGPISNPVPAPPGGGCVEKTITVTYYYNGRWYICCRKIWICNPFDCLEFDYRYDLNSNGIVFQLNTGGASNITWKDDTGGGDIGGGPISNPVPVPPNPGDCFERIISVKYFANGRWYLCCRRIWICNPFDCLEFDYRYDLNSNGMVFQLYTGGATNITWKDDTGGGDIGGGPISNPIPVPPNPGDCIERIISVKYFANGRWYICCRRIWICNPFDCGNIIFNYNSNSRTYQFELTQNGAGQITWKDDTGGGSIGGGPVSGPVSPPPNGTPCVEKIITARYFFNGRWYICCKRFWLCDPAICAAEIKSSVNTSGQVQLNVSSSYSDVTWFNQRNGSILGNGNTIQTNFPYGSDQEICVQYVFNGRTYMCCKSLKIVGSVILWDPEHKVTISPNPSRSEFKIEIDCLADQNFTVSVFNGHGVELIKKQIYPCNLNSLIIDTKEFKSGIHYVKIIGDGLQSVHKVEIIN